MRFALAIALAATALGGCGLPPSPTHGCLDSGFLSTYAHLAPDPVRPDALAWRLPAARLGDYEAVIVELPAMRRRPDDVLPSPEDRQAMALSLQAEIKRALPSRLRLLETAEDAAWATGRVLRVKTAITTALIDRGDLPPEPEHHGWGEVPMRFAFECEVLDAGNARPLARMVSFDRTQWVRPRNITPWQACTRDFAQWARDAAWLVQPPEAGARGVAAAASPGPVST
jgi:hypothetical protein